MKVMLILIGSLMPLLKANKMNQARNFDLKHFQEGFNSDFGKKLLHVLDLGKFQVESVG